MTDTTLLAASTDSPAANTPAVEGVAVETAAADTAQSEQAKTEATTQPAEGEKPEAAKDEAKAEGAPETYADFTVPEGLALDTEVLGEFAEAARELNLPQDQAQRVVDLGVKMSQKWAEQASAQVQEMQAGWRRDAEADPEIGGDALPQNLATAKKALDAFGSPALKEMIEDAKLGDHPEFIRLLVNVGKSISEDTLITPSGEAAKAPRSHAERIFNS